MERMIADIIKESGRSYIKRLLDESLELIWRQIMPDESIANAVDAAFSG